MSDDSRRFTDREVALVLKRASEIEEVSDAREGAAGALSLGDLKEIASEVGISAEALRQAVATLDTPSRGLGGLGSALEGAPLVRRAVHAVPRELNEADIADLMRRVDVASDSAGTVSEALGAVRWSASDRFMGTQVTVTPRDDQTTIEVAEKTPARLRRIMHFLPMAWSLVGALPVMQSGSGLTTIAAGGLALLFGATVGRGAFSLLSSRSDRRVRALAAELAAAAAALPAASEEVARPGSPDSPGEGTA